MKPIHGLDLTDEETVGVQKYREWVQRNRRAGHLRKHLAQIDTDYPGLDDEYRFELAESLYRAAMSKTKRQAYAELKAAADRGRAQGGE